jgi:hypothetical protein
MYEKYYTQTLHEVHNGEVVNDIYVEEFETPNKHIVKGTKNNNPFLFVLRNSHAPTTSDAVEKLLAQEKSHHDTKHSKKTKKTKKTKSSNRGKDKNKTKRSKQSPKANKTKTKK